MLRKMVEVHDVEDDEVKGEEDDEVENDVEEEEGEEDPSQGRDPNFCASLRSRNAH